jgi:lipopolysaccharide/colanic/teichoic acid biosynthesis glycosyltransferase
MQSNHNRRAYLLAGRGDRPRPPAENFRRADALSTVARARVIDRYASIRSAARWYRLRFLIKQSVWWAVVNGTTAVKRMIDIAGSIVLLTLLAPVFAGIALCVKLDSCGPVFYQQTRVMKWGRLFQMYKFRSMFTDAEERGRDLIARNEMAGGVTFKIKNDPRITRVGRLLRRGSIDELPQLWNVLKGEMSLVGPRPPLPAEVSTYSLAERRRLDVTPGITCIWQVSGRSEIPFERQVELDVAYIESQSLRGDLLLLLKTIPAVLMGRGAY